jgi:hypothetical protein
MRFNNVSIALIATLAMSAAACGGDDDDAPLTASGYITGLGGGVCGKAFECMSTFPGTPADFTATFGSSEAACPAALGFVSGAELQASVDAGRTTFDAAAGAMCIAGIKAFTCPQWWDPNVPAPASCSTVLVGTVADGGACTLNAECASGGGCDGTSHTCVAPAANAPRLPYPQALVHQLSR